MLSQLATIFGRLKKSPMIDIDDPISKLHYRFTSPILLVFCALIMAFGEPIHCIQSGSGRQETDAINAYCWIHSTYTLPEHLHKPYGPRTGIIHPGVGNMTPSKTYHAYYQWVPYVLVLQALMFYIPHWLWKILEGGTIAHITTDKEFTLEIIPNSIMYYIKYVACQILFIFNLLFNMWFMNRFLDGMFLSYGWDVLRFIDTDQEYRTDPMIVIFPRVTKCDFNSYGSSGSIEKRDFLCILTLNILHEKIFVFEWFWFVSLAFISIIFLSFQVIYYLKKRKKVGKLFILYLVSKNIYPVSFHKLKDEI